MIDPRIWDSQQVMQLSPEAFKTFIYLISQADDAGKLPVCWQMMASRIFPFGEVSADRLKEIVTEMDKMKLVILYVVDGKDFIKHPNWTRYQKIDRPSESTIPEPEALVERSSNTRRRLVPKLNEVKLREEKLKESNTSTAVAVGEESDPLYHRIKEAFLSKNGTFTNYGKEGAAINGIIEKATARNPDDPVALVRAMINTFWKLKLGNNKFYSEQPFLPSALNASGIWDRVLETMRTDVVDPEVMAIIKGAEK
jgi:hypothetical protein